MKNFLDLLATDFKLDVTINGIYQAVELHNPLAFNVGDLVIVDGIEILPRYQNLAVDNVLQISQPFYQWYHTVSEQGWLLKPQISNNNGSHDDKHLPGVRD